MRQKPSSKPCPPSQGSRIPDPPRNDSNHSCDMRRKAPSTSTYGDYPNTTYGQTPMVPSSQLITCRAVSSVAYDGVQPGEVQPASSKQHVKEYRPGEHSREIPTFLCQQQHQDAIRAGLSKPYVSSRNKRNTTEEFSNKSQQGSSCSISKFPSMIKDNTSVVASHHNPSSHFVNVRSFTTIHSANVSAVPHAEQCPNATSQSTVKQSSEHVHDAKQHSEIDEKGSTFDQAPMAPSREFQPTMVTPPELGELRNSPNDRISGYEVTEMHTPNEQQTCCERRDHSTPILGPTSEREYSFTSQGATIGDASVSVTNRKA